MCSYLWILQGLHSQIQKNDVCTYNSKCKQKTNSIRTEVIKMARFKNILGVVVIVASMVTSMCGVLGTGADLVEQIKK